MWTPTLYEQFSRPHGNLARIIDHGMHGTGSGYPATWPGGIGAVTAVTAVPPFWLPPTFADRPYDSLGGGQPFWLRVLALVVFVGIVIAALRWTVTHAERSLSMALLIGVTAWLSAVGTWRLNPNTDSTLTSYFVFLWPLSAYLWMILGTIGFRALLRPRIDRSGAHRGALRYTVAVVLVLTSLAALPRRNNCGPRCASSKDALMPVARDLRVAAAAAARDSAGPTLVVAAGVDRSAGMLPSVILGLQDAGGKVRVDDSFLARQFGEHRDDRVRRDATHELRISRSPEPPERSRLVGDSTASPKMAAETYTRLDTAVSAAKLSDATLERLAREQVSAMKHNRHARLLALVFLEEQQTEGGIRPLARYIDRLVAFGIKPDPTVLDIPGLSRSEARTWARESARRDHGTYFLYETRLE